MDPGRTNATDGCNTNVNKLYIDEANNKITGTCTLWGKEELDDWTLVQVRPNDGNYTGTINQNGYQW